MSDPATKLNLARQHFMAGRYEQARLLLVKVLQAAPGQPEAASAMALVLTQLGQHEQALYYARAAVQGRPEAANLLINLGNSLSITGRQDEALEVFQKAAAAMPERPEPRLGLANVYRNQTLYSKAAEHLRIGLKHHPADPDMAAILASVLLNLARVEESLVVSRAALEKNPGHIQLLSIIASALNYAPGVGVEEVFRAHAECGRAIAATAPKLKPGKSSADRSRPRLGLLSHDLRQHSVAYFVEPLLRHRGGTEIHCYHTSAIEDGVSARLKPMASSWRNVAGLADAALAERMRSDGIDILIETSGLTQGHRLAVMAARPAAVQTTFLGYPNTTGIPAIDYRIVDGHTDPEGAEARASEKLLRLDPCFLCYTPPPDAPEPGPPPSLAAGHVTFGSFNAAPKINGFLIDLWARTLGAVPGSRLILKAFDFRDEGLRADLAARFAAAGVGPDQLELLAPAPGVADHLALYRRIDIALDTFPYHGTTTTLEAVHMGVPVVTLEGAMHAGRVGVAILRNLGLEELIARDRDGYLAAARSLAADPARLAALRSSLRPRLAASPLCDGPGYARRFVEALARVWAKP